MSLLTVLAACASTDEVEGEAKARKCPPGRALVCTQRMGQQEECVCEREEKLQDIFESSTGP